MSRIAHKVFILNEEDRSDFLSITCRAALFTGIQLLGWCVMTNHFHLLVYLPVPTDLDEATVLTRYGYLMGEKAKNRVLAQIREWRTANNEKQIEEWLAHQKKRMYNVGEFMKIIKQWFTESYNSRYSHAGTLWGGAYVSRLVKKNTKEMAKRLGYIHLNPICAAICTGYDEYQWSSLSAVKRGDQIAIDGMRFIYGAQFTMDEIKASHWAVLDEQLDGIKRQRAEEIVRRRAVGVESPHDPLTDEALIIQAQSHMEEVRNAVLSMRTKKLQRGLRMEMDVFREIYEDPLLEEVEISKRLGCSRASVYRAIKVLVEKGVIERLSPTKPWFIDVSKAGLLNVSKAVSPN